MSVVGRGALAIWYSVAPDVKEAFDAWHSHYYIPARMADYRVARARRFVEVGETGASLILYEGSDGIAFGGAGAGRDRADAVVNSGMANYCQGRRRSVCRVLATRGCGDGSVIVLGRVTRQARDGALDKWEKVVATLSEQPLVIACHALEECRSEDAAGHPCCDDDRFILLICELPAECVILEGITAVLRTYGLDGMATVRWSWYRMEFATTNRLAQPADGALQTW